MMLVVPAVSVPVVLAVLVPVVLVLLVVAVSVLATVPPPGWLSRPARCRRTRTAVEVVHSCRHRRTVGTPAPAVVDGTG